MMFNEANRDRILVCRDCGNEFTFTTGEQEFYASRGLTNTPGRCPSCRSARRGGQSMNRAPREQHEAVCASCGRRTTVPFVPREDRPVYCSDCFQSQRSSRPRRDDTRSYSSHSGSGYGNSYGNGGGRRGGRDSGRSDRW
nr:zinc-ribbon domain containing protein [Tengunoibacter tsumagoiensis]